MPNRLSRLCLIPLVLSLACNALSRGPATPPPSPVPPTAASVTPATTVPPTTLAPTPEPVLPFTSLEDNLYHRINTGEWTLEQGLVTTLKFLLAQASEDDLNSTGREIVTYEANTLVMLATDYIQKGPDPAVKAELQHLLDVFLPDPQKLKPYSVPAPAASQPSALKVNAQTIGCADLALEGFPAGPQVACFEYRSEIINGREYEVYFPVEWVTEDRYPGLAEKTMEAVRESVNDYSIYGEVPAASIVFGLIPSTSIPNAAAVALLPAQCVITVYPGGRDLDVAIFQQVIAHEMFHCFQWQHYNAKMSSLETRGWWAEGTANYFSNLVYPDANYEHYFGPGFDAGSATQSLFQFTYENFVFYQYLGNQIGNEAILELIANSPTGGASEQQSYLSGVDGIDLLFQEFAQAYLDVSIQDSGGGVVPVSPDYGEAFQFGEGEQSKPFSVQPFVIGRYQLWFEDDMRFSLNVDGSDTDGVHAVRPLAFIGGWRGVPESLNTACSEDKYLLVLTSVLPPGSSTYEIDLYSIGERLEGEDPECDQCLLGTWQLTNESLYTATANLMGQGVALGGGLPPGYSVELVSVTGELTLTFLDTQHATGEQIDVTLTSLGTGPNGETMQTQAIYNGTAEAIYQTRDVDRQKVIAFSSPEYNLTFNQTLTIGDVLVANPPPIAMDDTNFSFFLSGSELYDCSEDVLLFTSAPTLGALQFMRVER